VGAACGCFSCSRDRRKRDVVITMHPVIAESRAILQRLAEADRQRELERLQRGPVEVAALPPVEEVWDPANPRGLTVATMSQREFNAWCDAGKPPLEKPKPQPQPYAAMRVEIEARLQTRLMQFASIVGGEVGKREKMVVEKLQAQLNAERVNFNIQLDALRKEVAALRDERSSGEIVDLPKWRGERDAA
jgi:hypothetical protein